MRWPRALVVLFALVVLLGLAAPASGGELVKHSGSIVAIADDASTFVLAEVGPWQVREGATVLTYVTIALAPDTEYALVARADEPPSGFGGDFVETRLGPEDVYLHDYVTVDCLHEGGRMVALKITVTSAP